VFVSFNVIDMEADDDVDKSTVGCYVSIGTRLLDVLVLSDSQSIQNKVKVPLNNPDDALQIIVKTLGDDEKKLGIFRILNI
jgi:hypothetical protein